jgi:C1A family cysteine protease
MAKTSLKHIYGWKRDLPDHRDFKVEHLHLEALPTSVDLRPHMPPCYDQGQLGSCTANGIAAIIEHQFISQGLPVWVPSRLFIYYCERAIEGNIHSDSGAEIRDGIKAVSEHGVCPESEWPYIESKFTDTPSQKCYDDAKKDLVQSYTSLGQNLPTLKSKLAQGFPIVFGITVYDSFESDKVAETGIIPMPKRNEECLGGHCIDIVGYDDSKSAFLIRNSWGTDWGINGYAWLPYAYVLNENLASDFWIIEAVK